MRTRTKMAIGVGWLVVGSYGCRQAMGWQEATLWEGEGGAGGGTTVQSSSSGSGNGGSAGMGGSAGAGGGGMGGVGGMAGAGGMGGGIDAGPSGCTSAAECPAVLNATKTCTDGVCGFTCVTDYGDCTAAAGCETSLKNNRNHCGACGNVCGSICGGTSCNDPVSIAGGYQHHCAVMKNGDVYCWGRNEKGELGDETLASKSVPTKVHLTSAAVQVDGGASASPMTYTPRTCAAMVNGELWCWGAGISKPAKVLGLTNIKEVSVGDSHICALNGIGVLYCWGGNNSGQVGNGTLGYVTTPTQITLSVLHVSAGAQHTCAVKTNGTVECWGDNFNGQLGIGGNGSQGLPTLVGAISSGEAVRCSSNYTCARAGGSLYCWGANQVGQLGTGGVNESQIPKLIAVQTPQAFDVGYNFTGAIDGGGVKMWGFNATGQLGNGMTNIVYTPAAIGLTNAQMLGLAINASCALLQNGAIRCWGTNDYGQLGNGTSQQKLLPTPVVWP